MLVTRSARRFDSLSLELKSSIYLHIILFYLSYEGTTQNAKRLLGREYDSYIGHS